MIVRFSQYRDDPSGAVISTCGHYRYALWRRWGDGDPVAFVGLNPSTADATADDNTIRRCVGFAKRFGCGGLVMLNLYAFRSTDPDVLTKLNDPVGPHHDEYVGPWLAGCQFSVAAWGGDVPKASSRPTALASLAVDHHGGLYCLGRTKKGAPRHPLYLRRDAKLETWCGSPKGAP